MNPIFTGLPTKLGLYILDELLASYENSELYAATQSYVDRAVVIEVLRPQSPPDMVKDFQESTRRRAAVTLPHVCPVLESVQTGAFFYLIQERPRGHSLSSLLAQGKQLDYVQGFALVQAAAELYSACQEKGLAAASLDSASIYMDGEEFSFFSPVLAGVSDAAHRNMQMAGLADVLEQVLPTEVLSESKLSVVVYSLRNGYDGVALEWKSLHSALVPLRTQKGSIHCPEQHIGKSLMRFAKKRYLKRVLRTVISSGFRLALMVLAIASVGLLINFKHQTPPTNQQHIDCLFRDTLWRVHTKPVSLAEYADFLKAYAVMNKQQQQSLHAGMPPDVIEHRPHDWKRQLSAAREGEGSSMDAPVRGVSYWDALAYARYAHEQLTPVELVRAARASAQEKNALEEWTDTKYDELPPFSAHVIVCSSQGDTFIRDVNFHQRAVQRGFRTAQILKTTNSVSRK